MNNETFDSSILNNLINYIQSKIYAIYIHLLKEIIVIPKIGRNYSIIRFFLIKLL